MNPSKDSIRRRRRTEFGAEALESRALLTGGAGDMFAIMPGTIANAGDTTTIKFTITPSDFHMPRGSMALGIDVAPASGSTVKPLISAVDDNNGNIIPQTFHSVYDPRASHLQVASGKYTSAVITPISMAGHKADATTPVTYSVQVQGQGQNTGDFLLGFYLPGDANGDGKVDSTDIALVKSMLNTRANSSKYSFAADANRDGRIGKIDLAYVLQNQGVSTDISPVVSSNLNPSSDSGLQDRITNMQTVNFTGSASPGATITYHDNSSTTIPDVMATTDSTGNYSVNVNLANGSNTFHVTSTDSFGQTIQGDISPVTFSATAPAVTPLSATPTSGTS